jgi:glycosyltransferase 2 family protein
VISRLRASRLPRVALVVVALVFCVYGLASRWDQTRHAATAFSWPYMLAALAAGILGLGAWMLAWRSVLAGLGSPLPLRAAVRVYFVSQLGKYIPGSVWALVAQMELAKEHHVPRQRGASTALLAMASTVATGCAVAAATLPLTSSEATRRYWWLLVLAPIFLALLHPRVVGFTLNKALTLARRRPLPRTADLRTMAVTVAWTALGWLLLGAHAWLLVRAAGGSGFFLATGAYALAFTAGFLVVIAPGGAGVREAALTVALGPVLAAGAPLVVALASRVVMTVADLAWAGSAVLLGSRHPALHEAETETETEAETAVARSEEIGNNPASG